MLSKTVIALTVGLCCLANLGFSLTEEKAPMTTPAITDKSAHPTLLMKTNLGNIEIELYPDKAPQTVENFLQYAKDGHFDNTIFHRVIPGFVVQGGGFTVDFKQKPTRAPVTIESDNGLKNKRGTLSMARTSDPNSATSQFFINLNDNVSLDFRSKTNSGWGYAVFGKVTKGMDIVDQMAKVKTVSNGGHQDVPVNPIEIQSVTVQ